MSTPKNCTVSMVGQDGRTYEVAVEAASLFGAADGALQQWARLWWYRPGRWSSCGWATNAGRSAPSTSECGAVTRADREADQEGYWITRDHVTAGQNHIATNVLEITIWREQCKYHQSDHQN
jgi:hypothetical protein